MKNWISRQWKDTKLLFRCVPALVVAIFTISVIAMNLLANKTIVDLPLLALDGGIVVSWVAFLCMDVLTKHFGPKAATKISIFAILVNILLSLVLYLVTLIPNESNHVFDLLFGGSWLIPLSSAIAFIVSAILNNLFNYLIGKIFKKNPDGKMAFITRSYISTLIGQFVDNLIFALLVFMAFSSIIFTDGFHWTFPKVLGCSLFGALCELLMEIIFSPFGYHISKKWKQEGVGQEYLEVRK